jgi:hypothetical protein
MDQTLNNIFKHFRLKRHVPIPKKSTSGIFGQGKTIFLTTRTQTVPNCTRKENGAYKLHSAQILSCSRIVFSAVQCVHRRQR